MTLSSTVSCKWEKYTASERVRGRKRRIKGGGLLKRGKVCFNKPILGGKVCLLVNLPICPDSFHLPPVSFLLLLTPQILPLLKPVLFSSPFLLLFQLYLFVKLYPLKLNEQLTLKL